MPAGSFVVHIADLAGAAFERASAAALPGVVPSVWGVPSAYPVGTPLYVPSGFVAACDRSDLNSECLAAYAAGTVPNGGRLGEVAAAKMALDHVAARERALHARHATPARLRAWAAARLAGHGDVNYGVFGAFAATVADTYAAATAAPNAQDTSG